MRKLTPEQIGEILTKGDFAQLVSTVEHEMFECKAGLYDVKQPIGKIEIAKDVSALANAKGGYLLVGVATERKETHKSDEVTHVSCFAQKLCDLDQYRKILLEYVYPPIRGLELAWRASATDASIGIVSICVPPEACKDRPFLVSQVQTDGHISGKLFGFFERIEDTAEPMRLQELRERLKDGMRYRDVDQRLDSIESLLARQSSESAEKKTEINFERLFQRAMDTRIAVGLTDVPCFYLLASPQENVTFPRLFESRESPEAKLFESPPNYRLWGFDLDTRSRSEIVRAELIRRVTSGRRGLDFWRDGVLIFVGRGDDELLGWACKSSHHELLINNIALIETICLFLRLSIEMFRLATPIPKQIKIFFEFMNSGNGKRVFKLGNASLSRQLVFDHGWREAPSKRNVFVFQFDLEGALAEAEAFNLVKEIYNWFGFTDDQIPYVDRSLRPVRLDPKLFMRGA